MQPKHLISVLCILCILILVVLWPRKNKKKTKKSVRENFIDQTMKEDNSTFSLFNWEGNNERNEESEDTIEHFPQPTPMNVIYTDTNGNLSNTSDLGLQNLTITSGGALQLGSKFRMNASKDMYADDDWLRLSNSANTDYYGGFAAGKLWSNGDLSTNTLNVRSGGSVAGGLNVGGRISTDSANVAGGLNVGGRISTDSGYGMVNNRNVKPNQLAGGNVQFGFGSMDNNSGGDYADTIHFNGWVDSSGGKPNLVMFNKKTPGIRIYQGDYNSGNAYTSYKDVVMADSNGNVGSIKIGSWVISENSDGHLVFSKNGAALGTADQGHIRMAQDGNLWLSRSSGPGWVADNIGGIRGDISAVNGKLDKITDGKGNVIASSVRGDILYVPPNTPNNTQGTFDRIVLNGSNIRSGNSDIWGAGSNYRDH